MATIKEDYVSFETALLLKEKGFEQIGCQKQYNTQGDLCVGYCYGPVAPTQQMAMRWLREVHNIHIDICSIYDTNRWLYQVFVITPRTARNSYVDKILYTSYEEAVESAIKYCLEHLI